MANNVWEADNMLDSYIYDYLLKRNLQNTAKAFEDEAHVSAAPVSIDAPGGFLFEWWSVFWDIFIARTNDKHSDAAASYLESIKARERTQLPQQQMQQFLQKRAQQQQHQNMQQQLLHHQQQEHLQQHRRQRKQQQHDGNGQFSTSDRDILLADSPGRQNSAPADSLSSKIYEERMKVPAQREALDEAANKQRFTESSGHLLDSNLASMLKSASVSVQASGQIVHGPVSGMSGSLQQAQASNQRLQGSMQDTKAETNVALNLRTVGDGSLIGVGVPGSDAGNNLTLKGWPLTGVEHLRSGFLQHKSFMQSPQQLQHLPFLTPQQQQLLLQTQQSMTSSHGDMDNRRLRMLYGSRNLVPGRDSQSNSFAEIIPSSGPSLENIGSPMQRMESDMLMKKIAALQQHQQTSNQQQLLRHPLLTSLAQNSNDHTGEQGEMVVGTAAVHGNLSNSFHGNEQGFKNRSGRKRKQPIKPSGPADSSGTANTAGPSPSSSPSTPAHSPEDTVSTPSLHHSASLSKALVVYGADAPGSIGSPTSQLVRMVDDDCLKDNAFLPHDEGDAIDAGSHCINSEKGSILREMSSARASTSSVLCCHFSSDGKLLATGGHDKKVVLWDTETLKQKSTLEEHSALISDVRFSPCIPRIATSSFDKTVRVWDADKPDYSVRTLTGHFASVMSLDFHPIKDDLICSCDGDNEMRFWSISDGRVVRIVEGGSTQLRFQPRFGGYLATASDNVVSMLDVETQACVRRFEGHAKHVDALCWDPFGEFVVSISKDAVNVWSLKLANEERPVHELKCTGSKFSSCAFHPTYPSLLIIGCYQYLKLWDLSENRTMTISAHDSLITSLAASSSGMVASTGHDKYVKLWGSPHPIAARSNR